MLDEYIKGTVSRMSPESPVPLLLRNPAGSDRLQLERLGGAGNAARNVASYGASVTLIGSVGPDRAGETLMAIADSHAPENAEGEGLKINCRFVVEQGRVSTHKLRLVNSRNVQLFRIDSEAYQQLSGKAQTAAFAMIAEEIPFADAIIVSDYAKGFITEALFAHIRNLAGSTPIIVDPKDHRGDRRLQRYVGAHSIIPNESELKNSFAWSKDLEELFTKDVRHVMDDNGVQAIICTRGDAGVLFAASGGAECQTVRGPKVEVADVTGASDTFTATYALALCATNDVAASVRLAEAASRGKVTKPMTGTITTSELKMIVDPPARRRAASKICDHNAFAARCLEARTDGASISFITGCFDILHRGHLAIFEKALEIGGFTAVAINSDSYVTRHKRPGGPYLDQEARALLVGSMAMVDAVCIFDDDDPAKLIEAIVPDTLIMGDEYRLRGDDLPGKSAVESAGGQIIFVPELRGYRTTALVDDIRKRSQDT